MDSKIKNRGAVVFLSVFLVGLLIGPWGCGGGSGSSGGSSTGLTLSTTVSLPSTTAATTLVVDGLKAATAETPQAGDTVTFYDAQKDSTVGKCTSAADGTCTATSTSTIAAGDTIIALVQDKNGNTLAGSLTPTGSTLGSSVATTVNTSEDVSFESWKASCKTQTGADCVPGTNTSAGVAKVDPSCLKTAMAEMTTSDALKTGATDTSDNYLSALVEAQKTNIATAISSKSAPPVNIASVIGGDTTAQTSMINTVGATLPSPAALTLKGASSALSTQTALDTATNLVNSVVNSMCGDPTTWATLKDDSNVASVFKMFKVLKPSEISKLDKDAMKKMIADAKDVGGSGNGFKTLGDPLIARAMMETFFAGGFKASQGDTEVAKRMGVVFGAGAPKDFNAAKEFGHGAYNVFGATTWGSATGDDAFKRLGPLIGTDGFRSDCLTGGSTSVDNYINGQGGLTAFDTAFDKGGTGTAGATAFFNAHDQKDVGGTCTATFDCLPPGVCSASKCTVGTATSLTGGPGTACTADSGCDSAHGFVCGDLGKCIYAAGQASGGNFGLGGTAVAPPTTGEGAQCTQNSQCSGGRICQNNGCFTPPTGGYTGGTPLGQTCSQNSQCASSNCAGNQCVPAGGYVNGTACTTDTQCASTHCSSNFCEAAGTTFTAKANGSSCGSPGECQSGNCSGGTCAALTATLKTNGSACNSGPECSSSNCVGGLCQAAGSTLKPNGATCTVNSECQSTNCSAGQCATGGSVSQGGSCTSNTQCQPPQTCKAPPAGGTSLFCSF